MSRGLLAVIAVALVAGCSASRVADEPRFVSGGVLRAHFWDTGSARVFIDWYDSRREVACRFADAEDGETRCLPLGGSFLFADAACTERVTLVRDGDDVPTYVRAALDPDRLVYSVGAERALTTTYTGGPGRCSAIGAPSGTRAFAVTRVDPTLFVRADVLVGPVGDDFDLATYVADDGTRELAGTRMHARPDVECALGYRDRIGVGVAQPCLPRSLTDFASAFADAACSTRAFRGVGSGGLVTIVDRVESGSCGPATAHVYELGAALPTSYTLAPGGACTPLDPTASTVPAYALGAELDVSSLPTGTMTTLGEGRALALVTRSASGVVVAATEGLFWDTDAAMACAPIRFADGVVRCVPGATGTLVSGGLGTPAAWYADAACTERLAPVSPCARQPYELDRTSSLTAPTGANEVGPVYDGPVWLGGASTCSASSRGIAELHRLGAAVDLDTAFVRLTERTE